MHDTRAPIGLQQPLADKSVESRLNWLLAENEREANHRNLFRNALEEEQILLMRCPVKTQQAFALFGLLLGTLPPAAIFFKIFGGALADTNSQMLWLILTAMNVICCLTGGYFGSKLSHMVIAIERDSWSLMIIEALIIGFLWALGTGAAGGLLMYGIGAIFGAACAIPVGALGFGLFVPLHRLLARGGMIDARNFWPLACGVVLTITALILGM